MTILQQDVAAGEIKYVVLFDPADPVLLARVRWPDIFQAISPARPEWQADPGLFDLVYNPSSTAVTFEAATAIAADWGAVLPAAGDIEPPAAQLIRRMPANWSNLSPAEERAWSIDFIETGKRSDSGNPRRSRWRRRRSDTVADSEDVTVVDLTESEEVIDLTDTIPISVDDVNDDEVMVEEA